MHNYKLPIALVISHVLLALLFTIEIKTIDTYTKKEKIIWFFIIWLVPLFGPYSFYKNKEKIYKLTSTINKNG